MDEWIVAGDAAFFSKGTATDRDVREKSRNPSPCIPQQRNCREWCNKAVWMERGEVKLHGDIEEVFFIVITAPVK